MRRLILSTIDIAAKSFRPKKRDFTLKKMTAELRCHIEKSDFMLQKDDSRDPLSCLKKVISHYFFTFF